MADQSTQNGTTTHQEGLTACAIRHGLTVLHRDRDFSVLAKVSPLLERNLLV